MIAQEQCMFVFGSRWLLNSNANLLLVLAGCSAAMRACLWLMVGQQQCMIVVVLDDSASIHACFGGG